jgi:dihydroorotate dehydrogenase electron transfer subunit
MDDRMSTWPILDIVSHSDTLKSFYFEASADVRPGQFIMLWIPGLDEKPFSVSDLHDGRMEVTVKAIGPFTRRLMTCQVGDRVGLRGPFGRPFVPTDHALIAGAGCGVAPVRFLHRTMQRAGRPCTFLVGTRHSDDLMFRDEYQSDGTVIVTDDGSLGERRLLPDKARELVESRGLNPTTRKAGGPDPGFSTLCASGPEVVLLALRSLAKAHGLPVQLSFERYMKCGIGLCGQCCLDGNGLRTCIEGPVLTHKELDSATDLGLPHRTATGCRAGAMGE